MVSYMEKGKASGIGPVLLKLFRIFPPSFSTSRHSFIEKRTNQSLSCFDLLPPTFCSGRKILRNSCSKHFWQQLSGASDCVAWRHQSQQVGWKARALLFVPESQKITVCWDRPQQEMGKIPLNTVFPLKRLAGLFTHFHNFSLKHKTQKEDCYCLRSQVLSSYFFKLSTETWLQSWHHCIYPRQTCLRLFFHSQWDKLCRWLLLTQPESSGMCR